MDELAAVGDDLRRRSWSSTELILTFDDALDALVALREHGVRRVGWEGLAGWPDKRIGGTSIEGVGPCVIGTVDYMPLDECRHSMEVENIRCAGKLTKVDNVLLFCVTAEEPM